MIINQHIIFITITRNLSISERTKNPLKGRKILFVTIVRREATKLFNVKTEGKIFCQNIRTYSKGQTYFFFKDIVSDKSNLLVDCVAT